MAHRSQGFLCTRKTGSGKEAAVLGHEAGEWLKKAGDLSLLCRGGTVLPTATLGAVKTTLSSSCVLGLWHLGPG